MGFPSSPASTTSSVHDNDPEIPTKNFSQLNSHLNSLIT